MYHCSDNGSNIMVINKNEVDDGNYGCDNEPRVKAERRTVNHRTINRVQTELVP